MNNKFQKNIFLPFLMLLFLSSFQLQARVHDFETARLKSTAGCGVASILMDESSILNPAPVAFYNLSSAYIQKHSSKYSEPKSDAPDPHFVPEEKGSYGLILSDAKQNLKGSLSYVKQTEWDNKRTRWSAALASVMGQYSSLGFGFRKTKDLNRVGSQLVTEDYLQMTVGAIHAVKPELSFGVLVVDPFKAKSEDNRFYVGAQWMLYKIIILMADIGSDYNNDLSKGLVYRGALQINFFSDLFLRLGVFHDKKLEEKGSGFGLGWVTPRFVADLGIKNTKQFYNRGRWARNGYPPSKLRDLAFSLGVKF